MSPGGKAGNDVTPLSCDRQLDVPEPEGPSWCRRYFQPDLLRKGIREVSPPSCPLRAQDLYRD